MIRGHADRRRRLLTSRMTDERLRDDFFIDQLIRPVANLYRISTLGLDGLEAGEPLAFVRQKKLALKEDIRFYADESEQQELFRIKARQMFELKARYDVTTPEGERIGVLEKVFGKSILRSTWKIHDERARARHGGGEEHERRALPRSSTRSPTATSFLSSSVHHPHGRGEVGELRRPIGVRDRRSSRSTATFERRIDRRVVVALGIALDALQSR